MGLLRKNGEYDMSRKPCNCGEAPPHYESAECREEEKESEQECEIGCTCIFCTPGN